jgi:hypothetical protein
MTFRRRNWRGIFGTGLKPGDNEKAAIKLLARTNQYDSKNEQVKRLQSVLKSSAPKDTEVIASMAQRDLEAQSTPLSSDKSIS